VRNLKLIVIVFAFVCMRLLADPVSPWPTPEYGNTQQELMQGTYSPDKDPYAPIYSEPVTTTDTPTTTTTDTPSYTTTTDDSSSQ
jgi:hypothetical protein